MNVFFACFGEFQVWGFRYYWLVGPLQISFVFVVVRLLDVEEEFLQVNPL